jgi:hypothetical protein
MERTVSADFSASLFDMVNLLPFIETRLTGIRAVYRKTDFLGRPKPTSLTQVHPLRRRENITP